MRADEQRGTDSLQAITPQMEPASPSAYSSSSRGALHNRVSVLPSRSPRAVESPQASSASERASKLPLHLTIAPRPSFRALAMRSNSTRPPSSTRSVIDPTAPQVLNTAAPTTQSPAVPMTPQEGLDALYASPFIPIDHTWHTVTEEHPQSQSQRSSYARRRSQPTPKRWSRLFSASSFKRHRVRTKAVFSIVFGITLIFTLGIYLGLAAADIGRGLMFHILFIIFILALTTVFCHSLLTMCLLILRTKPRRIDHVRRSSISHADMPPEKPIPIVMAIDEEAGLSPLSPETPELERPIVRPPPPIYGVWRDTKRMDPNLVHWAKLPPSPDTPTYEEALQDVQRAVGNRPPSYVNGVLVQEADLRYDSMVHPLERDRVEMLFGEML